MPVNGQKVEIKKNSNDILHENLKQRAYDLWIAECSNKTVTRNLHPGATRDRLWNNSSHPKHWVEPSQRSPESPNRVWEDLQGGFSEYPQIQACKDWDIRVKNTGGWEELEISTEQIMGSLWHSGVFGVEVLIFSLAERHKLNKMFYKKWYEDIFWEKDNINNFLDWK